ncbi:MAG: hypothetical protein LBM74_07790 [Oscillospiraceae bacterium]|jgi:hypothetical protein|nr:hypothetical protein [Oscillospiraceae bacterium]
MKRLVCLMLMIAMLASMGVAAQGALGEEAEAHPSFTMNGITYRVEQLEDVMGLGYHEIMLSAMADAFIPAPEYMPLPKVVLVAPDGTEIIYTLNSVRGAYTYPTVYIYLAFKLPDNVMLGDCILRVNQETGVEEYRLDKVPKKADEVPTAAPAQAAPSASPLPEISFIVRDTTYYIERLEDNPAMKGLPAWLTEEIMDSNLHAIVFGWDNPWSLSAANKALAAGTVLHAPDGSEIAAQTSYLSKASATSRSYTHLYFALPDGVMLGDCTLVMNLADGAKDYPLGEIAAMLPTASLTASPTTRPTASLAPTAIPTRDFPESGRISGSTSGTKVIVKAPYGNSGYYVQFRLTKTNEKTVDLFVRPGESATVYTKPGTYYLMVVSGETWYGLEGSRLFGENGEYYQTYDTEIKGSGYTHTISLDKTADGNLGIRSIR